MSRLVSRVFAIIGSIHIFLLLAMPTFANAAELGHEGKQFVIPILGTSLNYQGNPIGVVAQVQIEFEERRDQDGLQIHFQRKPGRLSARAQQAVREATLRAAQVADLRTDSWKVTLTVPYHGITIYGDSLSAMVALSVVALAKGDPLPSDRAITGTITPEGRIGTVGGVPYKIHAAHARHFRRVLIPEEQHVEDGDWRTPFLMQVSPVQTVHTAYLGLTDRPL